MDPDDSTTFRRPTLVLNPRSGGGRHQPAVLATARRRGWTVHEVGPTDDPAKLAADPDADVLLVGGGDGTVGAVAGVAVARDLPLVVVPCGTRNHFAADAGMDLTDPEAALDAVDHGTETRVDVGTINGRLFLNTVSVGFYSAMVSDPHYRSQRLRVSARYLRRAVLGGGTPVTLSMRADPRVLPPEQVLTVLVSNNAYSPGTAPGPSLRPRLDEGVLFVHLLGVQRRGPLVHRVVRAVGGVLAGWAPVAVWAARTETIDADRPRLKIGMDGEAVELDTPLELACRPAALRLLVPPRPPARELKVDMHT